MSFVEKIASKFLSKIASLSQDKNAKVFLYKSQSQFAERKKEESVRLWIPAVTKTSQEEGEEVFWD